MRACAGGVSRQIGKRSREFASEWSRILRADTVYGKGATADNKANANKRGGGGAK